MVGGTGPSSSLLLNQLCLARDPAATRDIVEKMIKVKIIASWKMGDAFSADLKHATWR